MPRKPTQKQMLEEMHAKVTQTAIDVDFMLNKIRVNGQEGLQPILTESYKNIKDLKDRTTFLERITAKTASTYALWDAVKKWADQRKWISVIFKMVFNKIVFRLTVGFLLLGTAALLGDRISSLAWKIFHIIK